MLAKFICASCENEIRVRFEDVGDWVACPICSYVQVAPDPPLMPRTDCGGYVVGSFLGSSLLAQSYSVAPGGKFQGSQGLMLAPTSFFVKNVSDLNAFAYAAVSGGKTGIPGMSKFVDKVEGFGKIFFVYERLPDSVTLSDWVASSGPLDNVTVSKVMRGVSVAMGKVWKDFAMPHMNLTPASVLINPKVDVEISGYGLSGHLLRDSALMAKGFSIWDTRFMSPEMRSCRYDFGSPLSDVYSLGASAYFLLTGRPPYADYSFDGADPYADSSLDSLAPAPLLQLVRRMVDPDPSRRPRSWEELIHSIDASTGGPSRVRHHTLRLHPVKSQQAEEEVSTNSVGLTRMSVKVEKRLSLRKAGPSLESAVARQATPDLKSSTGRWKQKGSNGAGAKIESRVRFLVVLAVVMVAVAVGAVSILSSKMRARPLAAATEAYSQGDESLPSQTRQRAAQAPRPPAAQEAPAPQAQPDAVPAPDSAAPPQKDAKPKGKLRAALAEIDGFVERNPESFASAISKYEALQSRAQEDRDFTLLETLQGRLEKLNEARSARLSEFMKGLDAKAKSLADSGNIEGATNVYLEYRGPLERESRALRAEAAERVLRPDSAQPSEQSSGFQAGASAPAKSDTEIEASAKALAAAGRYSEAIDLLESYHGADAARTENSRRALSNQFRDESSQLANLLEPVLPALVSSICSLDSAKALAILAKAMEEPAMKPALKTLKSIAAGVEAFKGLDSLFLDDLNSKASVQLVLAGRKPDEYSVVAVKGGSASLKSSSGESLSVSFKDLSIEAKVAFASKSFNLDESPVLCAMLAIQSRDKAVLKRALKRLPLDMDALFGPALKDRFAKEEFEKMLEAAGVRASDYSQIVPQMRKREFSSHAESVLSSLQDLARKYEGLDFISKNEDLFNEMTKICRSCLGSTSPAASSVVGKESLDKMSMSLQDLVDKAEPGASIELKRGSYSLPAGAALLIAKNGIKIVCEEGVEIDGGVKIMGSKVSLSNIVSKEGNIELIGASDAKIENCVFLLPGSSIKNSSKVSIENCVFKTFSVIGSKDVSMNHCTIPGSSAVKCSLAFSGDELSVTNSVLYCSTSPLGVSEKSGKGKLKISGSLIYGESALCAELQEGSDSVKKLVKTEGELSKYVKSQKNVFAPAQFVAAAKDDYSLAKSSPGALKASDGKDCGFVRK